jgi:hypothetical protein
VRAALTRRPLPLVLVRPSLRAAVDAPADLRRCDRPSSSSCWRANAGECEMASLALESFIDELIRRCGQRGYVPRTFIGMRARYGTVEAISRLVSSGDVQDGFHRLIALGLRDWSVESAVTKFPDEFSREVRQAAEWRLAQISPGSH